MIASLTGLTTFVHLLFSMSKSYSLSTVLGGFGPFFSSPPAIDDQSISSPSYSQKPSSSFTNPYLVSPTIDAKNDVDDDDDTDYDCLFFLSNVTNDENDDGSIIALVYSGSLV